LVKGETGCVAIVLLDELFLSDKMVKKYSFWAIFFAASGKAPGYFFVHKNNFFPVDTERKKRKMLNYGVKMLLQHHDT